MKVLLVNSYDFGGAGIACIRLHRGLLKEGIDSKLLFLQMPGREIPCSANFQDFEAKINGRLKRLKRKIEVRKHQRDAERAIYGQPKGHYPFSIIQTPYDITQHPFYKEADIIHLHWVADFLDWSSFFRNVKKPVVWTLHDMNPFTGGCHHAEACLKFQSDCSQCPQLKGTANPNLASEQIDTKLSSNTGNVTVVSPSQWLKSQSESGKLFGNLPHHCIPSAVDSTIFKRRDKNFCRELFSIPADRKVMLFVAQSVDIPLKGVSYLLEALKNVEQSNVVLCLAGAGKIPQVEFSCNVISLGAIRDERLMAMAYAAADVFVFPSLVENLPNVIIESLLCGTPVIGFNIGGNPDMVRNGENGYLCDDISADSLAKRINEFFEKQHVFNSDKIRNEAVKKFDLPVQARAYMNLYKNLLH